MPVFESQAQIIAKTASYGINGPGSLNYDAGKTIRFSYTNHEFSFTRLARDYTELHDLRNFNQSAGDFERVVHADGGWTVVDTSGGNNTFTISPPSVLQPTFIEDTYYLADYRESQRSPSGVADVDLTFIRESPREPEDEINVPSQAVGSDDWEFDTHFGRIAVPSGQLNSNEEGSGRTVELTATLTDTQAEIIMEGPNRYGATSVETIPDEQDYARDNHPNNRNTVHVATPTDLANDWFRGEGDYIIRQWEISTTSVPFRYEWTVTLRPDK